MYASITAPLPHRRFGRLTPVALFKQDGYKEWKILCVCDCGSFRDYRRSHLDTGTTKSCGCAGSPRALTHGDTRDRKQSTEWRSWHSMINRCRRVLDKNYKYYGGRGISVCVKWQRSFARFLADMGRKPSPLHTIERINNDGNYEPGNCRWATRKEQACNRRRPVLAGERF